MGEEGEWEDRRWDGRATIRRKLSYFTTIGHFSMSKKGGGGGGKRLNDRRGMEWSEGDKGVE